MLRLFIVVTIGALVVFGMVALFGLKLLQEAIDGTLADSGSGVVGVVVELAEFAEEVIASSCIEESARLLGGGPDVLGHVVHGCLAVVDESSEGAVGGVCGFHVSFVG